MKDIEKLKNDKDYYGDVGKKYLSNSDIGTLIKTPALLRQERPETVPMVQGRYFHNLILEPEKVKDYEIVDASTRSTKIYKEASGEERKILLLKSEVEELHSMGERLLANTECRELIQHVTCAYEVPATTNIGGLQWKGKADIINEDKELIVDIKTTSNLNKFKWSAFDYNYDSQAFIYNQLFNKPMMFIVIEKGTNRLGIFDCSADFYAQGEEKVNLAIKNYNRFYVDKEDVNQYLYKHIL